MKKLVNVLEFLLKGGYSVETKYCDFNEVFYLLLNVDNKTIRIFESGVCCDYSFFKQSIDLESENMNVEVEDLFSNFADYSLEDFGTKFNKENK